MAEAEIPAPVYSTVRLDAFSSSASLATFTAAVALVSSNSVAVNQDGQSWSFRGGRDDFQTTFGGVNAAGAAAAAAPPAPAAAG